MDIKRGKGGPGSCQWTLRGGRGSRELPVDFKRGKGVQEVASGRLGKTLKNSAILFIKILQLHFFFFLLLLIIIITIIIMMIIITIVIIIIIIQCDFL